MTLTNTVKDITDLIPFKNKTQALFRDRNLMRYLILSLPFIENIVSTVLRPSFTTLDRICDKFYALQVLGQPRAPHKLF